MWVWGGSEVLLTDLSHLLLPRPWLWSLGLCSTGASEGICISPPVAFRLLSAVQVYGCFLVSLDMKMFLFSFSLLFCSIFERWGTEIIWTKKSSTMHSRACHSLLLAPAAAPDYPDMYGQRPPWATSSGPSLAYLKRSQHHWFFSSSTPQGSSDTEFS